MRADDELHLVGLDEGLALGGDGLDELRGAQAELLGEIFRQVDVHAGVVGAALEPQARLVELDADLDGAPGGGAATSAAAEAKGSSDRNGGDDGASELHSSSWSGARGRSDPAVVRWGVVVRLAAGSRQPRSEGPWVAIDVAVSG